MRLLCVSSQVPSTPDPTFCLSVYPLSFLHLLSPPQLGPVRFSSNKGVRKSLLQWPWSKILHCLNCTVTISLVSCLGFLVLGFLSCLFYHLSCTQSDLWIKGNQMWMLSVMLLPFQWPSIGSSLLRSEFRLLWLDAFGPLGPSGTPACSLLFPSISWYTNIIPITWVHWQPCTHSSCSLEGVYGHQPGVVSPIFLDPTGEAPYSL
jgi:hypothetical protein